MIKNKFMFLSSHNGEYWYECPDCKATEWFSYYSKPKPDQILSTCTCAVDTAKKYDTLVFIGRFQPFHKGHEAVITKALTMARKVVVVVGSSFAARNIRNPFTFVERATMITEAFNNPNIIVKGISDYPYDDNKWKMAVRRVVKEATPDAKTIGLIGHSKDSTSYYLKIFPDWGSVEADNVDGLNATDIRNTHLSGFIVDISVVPPSTNKFLTNFRTTNTFQALQTEYKMIKKYKESWKAAPFPPTFMTVDNVVLQSGHILLVKRNAMPGKGLWALPGGFLDQSETMLEGAIRELIEETKIDLPKKILLGSVTDSKTFDAPNRSTRGRTITQAFKIELADGPLIKVKKARDPKDEVDDAEEAKWFPLNEVYQDQMFEDHYAILDYFCNMA